MKRDVRSPKFSYISLTLDCFVACQHLNLYISNEFLVFRRQPTCRPIRSTRIPSYLRVKPRGIFQPLHADYTIKA